MNRVILSSLQRFRCWLALLLQQWAMALQGESASGTPPPLPPGAGNGDTKQTLAAGDAVAPKSSVAGSAPEAGQTRPDARCPAIRPPLSIEEAVLDRDMTVLRREAADALAALGAAHVLVASARLARLQRLRPRVEEGNASGENLMALAADYQAWQNDQVRLLDAMALVLRMKVPEGNVLDQVDPDLHEQARNHLQSLSLEYQRRLLMNRFSSSGSGAT